jgi:hypothetical protein
MFFAICCKNFALKKKLRISNFNYHKELVINSRHIHFYTLLVVCIMKKISCKPYLINRLVFVLLLGGTMVFVPILLYFFDSDTLDVLTNTVMLNTVFTVFMLYLTRNEVYIMIMILFVAKE